ncbi:hypothetical protein H8356DRAFT_1057861 [Neocallimastix lanati (nom. inval.)]|uniref:Cyclin N-terminal domain-containing protein n=1 Tax=Neocallimastix californiae TaxID=1754190 RepID=A0A1Y2BPX3_9FUNG|nr:hypothetical protein H8356DRAFT_1057861 [Neocallimastix sp. JGI-2020a]ORY36801.1 hypothetical protein LY90DRAFT_672990 [Neocallimastix californiae]|eukprot:ORY36801.1 hypothetical protein LY90DRAFT_672990 [Neocallimastix californiae]
MSVITMSIDDNTINNIDTSIAISTNNLSSLLKNKMDNRINLPVISKEQLQQQIQIGQVKIQQPQIIQTNQPILSQAISLTQPSQPPIIKVIHVAQPVPPNSTQNVFIPPNTLIRPNNLSTTQALNIPMPVDSKRRHSIPNIMEQDQGPSPNQPGPRRLSVQLNEIPLTNPDAMVIDPKPVTHPTTVKITDTSPAATQATVIAAAPSIAAHPQIRYIYGIPRAPSLPINNIVPVTMSPIQPLKTFPALPLSNFVVYLVNRIWYHGKPECRNTAQPKYAELTKFVEDVLKITDLSLNTVLLSLRYIYMLRQKCVTDQKVLEWSIKDLISVHFMLANKFLSDDRYSNSVWASVCNKDLDEMNLLEKKSLEILQFNLNVHEDEFKSWEKSITNLGKELRQRMTTLQQERNLKKQQAELTALLNETMSNTNIIQMPLFHQAQPFSTLVVNNVPAIPINPGAATINIVNAHPVTAITQNPAAIITTNTQVAPTLATTSLNLKFTSQPTNIANVANVVSTANTVQMASVANATNVAAIAQQNPIPINAVAIKHTLPVTTSPKVSVTPMYVCNNKLVTSLPAAATATGLTVVNPTSNAVRPLNSNSIYPSPPLCRVPNSQPTAVLATPNFVGPAGPATITLVSTNGEVSTINATRGINTLTGEPSSSTKVITPQTIHTTTLIPATINNGNVNVPTPTTQTGVSASSNNCRFLKHSLSSTSLNNLQQQQQLQPQFQQSKTNYNSPLTQHHMTGISSGSRLKTSNSALNLSSVKNSTVFKYQPQSIINHTATLNNLNELNLPISRIPTPLNYSSPKKMRFSTGVTSSAHSGFIKKENIAGVPLLTTSPLNGLTQVQLPPVMGPNMAQNNTIIKATNTSDPTINIIQTNKPMFY